MMENLNTELLVKINEYSLSFSRNHLSLNLFSLGFVFGSVSTTKAFVQNDKVENLDTFSTEIKTHEATVAFCSKTSKIVGIFSIMSNRPKRADLKMLEFGTSACKNIDFTNLEWQCSLVRFPLQNSTMCFGVFEFYNSEIPDDSDSALNSLQPFFEASNQINLIACQKDLNLNEIVLGKLNLLMSIISQKLLSSILLNTNVDQYDIKDTISFTTGFLSGNKLLNCDVSIGLVSNTSKNILDTISLNFFHTSSTTLTVKQLKEVVSVKYQPHGHFDLFAMNFSSNMKPKKIGHVPSLISLFSMKILHEIFFSLALETYMQFVNYISLVSPIEDVKNIIIWPRITAMG